MNINFDANSPEVIERNNKALKAWNEWKIECAVGRCSGENQRILTAEIAKAFRKKLKSMGFKHQVMGYGKLDNSNSKLTKEERRNKDYVQFFDMGIQERMQLPGLDKRTGRERIKKNYKNVAWDAAAESQDPPLSVIRGMLLGRVDNFMTPLHAIVIDYLVNENGFIRTTNEKGNLRVMNPMVSLETPLESDGSGKEQTLEDIISDDDRVSGLLGTDYEEIDEMLKEFSPIDAAFVLAEEAGMEKTNPALLEFLGIEKSQAYIKRKESLSKLSTCLADYSKESNAIQKEVIEYVCCSLWNKLKSEKSSAHLLMEIERAGNEKSFS